MVRRHVCEARNYSERPLDESPVQRGIHHAVLRTPYGVEELAK